MLSPENASPVGPASLLPVSVSVPKAPSFLPKWAAGLVELYSSNSSNQFILHGNVDDLQVMPGETADKGVSLGSLEDFLKKTLLKPFEVILIYDLGHGLRVERGGEIYQEWPSSGKMLPKSPREAMEVASHFLRYHANLQATGGKARRIAFLVRSADLLLPGIKGVLNNDLNAMALLVREWSADPALRAVPQATFLIAQALSDLHPLLTANPRASVVEVPLPQAAEAEQALRSLQGSCPVALSNYKDRLPDLAAPLAGATLSSIESLLRQREFRKTPLVAGDVAELRKSLIEKDCQGLIDFIESDRSFADVYGQEGLKTWFRQDIALWAQGELAALPMGYLICGPVGTGKTFIVECLAGEAGVPVVKLKNFRDKWVGSTEANLEKIFRLLAALGRCLVFIDEADQALGRRQADSGDSGVGGRVYSMMAEQMSNTRNRGKVIWVLATSRPDLVEVDLKRPGRVDVKIPLFPSTTPEEGYNLLQALCKRRKLALQENDFASVKELIPDLLTPGAAEAVAVKAYRLSKTQSLGPLEALKAALQDYQAPVSREVMDFQIEIARAEATDLSFVPERFRK